MFPVAFFTYSLTVAPSHPAFQAICFRGASRARCLESKIREKAGRKADCDCYACESCRQRILGILTKAGYGKAEISEAEISDVVKAKAAGLSLKV